MLRVVAAQPHLGLEEAARRRRSDDLARPQVRLAPRAPSLLVNDQHIERIPPERGNQLVVRFFIYFGPVAPVVRGVDFGLIAGAGGDLNARAGRDVGVPVERGQIPAAAQVDQRRFQHHLRLIALAVGL